MISQEKNQEAIQRLVKAYDPVMIYFFGKYAWGAPDNDDDLNILIRIDSSDEKASKRGYKAFTILFEVEIPTSVTVFTKQEFDTFSQDPTTFTHEVKQRGKIVYARS